MTFSFDPSKKDLLLPLKRDAALWCWCPGVSSKEMVEAMLATKYVNEKAAAKELAEEAWAKRTSVGSLIQQQGMTKKLTSLESLNKRYAQLNCRGQGRLTIRREDFSIVSDKDFEKEVAGETIFGGISKKGEYLFLDAKDAWLGSYDRAVFNRLAFTSKPIEVDVCNLFPGFGTDPKAGCCNNIFSHIYDVLCAGDTKTAEAFVKLLAWQVQNIGEPSRVIVALKSNAHQTGKSIFLTKVLGKIYGDAGFITADTEKIFSRFNSTLKGKAFVCLEEALFSKSKKDSDTVKSITTAKELALEAKFQDSIMMPVAINLFLATNHDACAYIEPKDKRYWILNISEHRCGDDAYFNELVDEIDSGGVEAFFHTLLNTDVSDFLPWRDVPLDNAAKLDMIELSVNSCSSYIWLRECASTNTWLGSRSAEAPCAVEWQANVEVDFAFLYEWYQRWAVTNKSLYANAPDNQKKLANTLTLANLESTRSNTSRKRKVLPAEEVLGNLKLAFRNRLFS